MTSPMPTWPRRPGRNIWPVVSPPSRWSSSRRNLAAKGAVNGVVRGTTVAVTQAVLGANPLTAGIGLVAPDAIALVCAGPIGWLGLAGLSIASAYGKASAQGSASPLQGG